MRLAVGLAPLAVYAACTFGDVDYTGKACSSSCPEPWVCLDGLCALGSTVHVQDLHATWVTPNSIRWEWTPVGDLDDVAHYELALASDRPDAAGTKTWTATDNPELSGGVIAIGLALRGVVGTVTDGLDPATPYRATLTVIDRHGGHDTSGPALQSTDSARVERVTIFRDVLPPPAFLYPGPPSHVVDPQPCGVSASPCVHYILAQDPAASRNGNNLKITSFPLRMTTTAFELDHAYLEFYARSANGTPKSNYSNVWLRTYTDPSCVDPCLYETDAWVYSTPSEYRRVQIPLSALTLRGAGTPITPTELALPLGEFNLFPVMDTAEELFLDQIGIFY